MKLARNESHNIFSRLTRRGFFCSGGIAALAGLFGAKNSHGKTKGRITTYESIGVRPIINCHGGVTILSGSLMLPEVNAAIEEGAHHYVQMNELMEGAGRRIAELTGAEWGTVTSGACGAIVAATAACMTGSDQQKIVKLPDTTGMKNEVLLHVSHRNGFFRYIGTTGAKIVEYDSRDAMEAAVNDKTAMICVLGAALDNKLITIEEIVAVGKKHGIPVFVDAAAERPDVPNYYLKAGVDIVCYSGGKCIRGPQSAGLLFGRKDLCQAATLNMSPNYGIGRPMKVDKGEIVGMLTALDMWINYRDHKAEFREWERKLGHIAKAAMRTPGVNATINQPTGRLNVAPALSISWDTTKVRITQKEANRLLQEGKPSIRMPSSGMGLSIMSFMLEKGDEVIIGKRLREIFSAASI